VRVKNSYSFMHLVTRKQLVVSERDKLQPALKIEDTSVPGAGAQSSSEAERLFSAVQVSNAKGSESLMTLEPLDDDRKELHIHDGGRVRFVHTQSHQYLHCTSGYTLKEPVRRLPPAQVAQLVRRRGLTHLQHQTNPGAGGAAPMAVPDRVLVASPALFREDSFDIVKVPPCHTRIPKA
jgi:hypothetical protein